MSSDNHKTRCCPDCKGTMTLFDMSWWICLRCYRLVAAAALTEHWAVVEEEWKQIGNENVKREGLREEA